MERLFGFVLLGLALHFVTPLLPAGVVRGLWTALLVACRIPFVVVAPPQWRRKVGLRGVDKTAVRLAACRRFPATPLKLDHADAVMLAVAAALEHGADQRAEGDA